MSESTEGSTTKKKCDENGIFSLTVFELLKGLTQDKFKKGWNWLWHMYFSLIGPMIENKIATNVQKFLNKS